MTSEQRKELFDYLYNTFDVAALESEIDDIAYIVQGKEQYIKEANEALQQLPIADFIDGTTYEQPKDPSQDELWNEMFAILSGSSTATLYPNYMEQLKSQYTIKKK